MTRFAVAYDIKVPFTIMVESQAGSVVHNTWYDLKHVLHVALILETLHFNSCYVDASQTYLCVRLHALV